ncbi:MAG: hypothetical protein IPI88_15270 [Chitinophagaceae bacterium]|nr:hypothetical protein [Chitinophagaceae bacterium]
MRFNFLLILILVSLTASATDSLSFTQTEIIYGRKDGMALTMMMLKPKQKANGKAIISVLNGNWVSAPRMMEMFLVRSNLYLESGYTLFGVMVGSQPQYAIPDQIIDLKEPFVLSDTMQRNIVLMQIKLVLPVLHQAVICL